MAREEIIVGLDIGSTKVTTIVALNPPETKKDLEIIGVGVAPSTGLNKGVVTNVEETVTAISKSLEEAERMAGVSLNSAFVSLGGSHINSLVSHGVVAVEKHDGEISADDVNRVIRASEAVSLPSNSEIIHVIPRFYSVDGQEGVKDPIGMSGIRLEVDTLIIYASTPAIRNLAKCVVQAGIEIEEMVAAPLASAQAVLTERQKELGVAVVDLGGGTTQLAVFEEGALLHLKILPVGSSYITNDIAIGIRTPDIDLAERVKLEFGTANPEEVSEREIINLAKLEPEESGEVKRKYIAQIIRPRLDEIFSMVKKELKGINRDGLLPAGLVLTGGGAKLPGIVDRAKDYFKVPAQVGFPINIKGVIDKVDDPSYATSIGLVFWGQNTILGESFGFFLSKNNLIEKTKKWFKSFLP